MGFPEADAVSEVETKGVTDHPGREPVFSIAGSACSHPARLKAIGTS